jgi:hypothetical protein
MGPFFFVDVCMKKRMSRTVIEYCRARQALRDEQGRQKETLEETADARRVHMDLLRESMTKNTLDCVTLPPDADGNARYARLVPAPVQYTTFRSWEDVSPIAGGYQDCIDQVPAADVPGEVVRLFLQRAARPRETAPRLVILPKVPHRVQPASPPPAEVTRLGRTLHTAMQEYKTCREPIKALRAKTLQAEKQARGTMVDDVPVLLQMSRDGRRRLVNVSKRTSNARPRSIGIRVIRKAVTDAARYAVHDRANFDARFKERLQELVTQVLEEKQPAPKTTLVVRERRVRHEPSASDAVVLAA